MRTRIEISQQYKGNLGTGRGCEVRAARVSTRRTTPQAAQLSVIRAEKSVDRSGVVIVTNGVNT
jgi:hypothetical protein